VPEQYLDITLKRVQKVRDTLSAWFRGQLILGVIAGSIVFLMLSILGIKYAAVSGLLSGLLNFFPILVQVLLLYSVIFCFYQRWSRIIFCCLLFYITLQQIQIIFCTKVMQKAVGLNPIVSIIAVLIGAKFASILGALIAIPVATAVSTILQDVFKKK
jgi:predicted PurR-regulated permease PerM